MMSRHARHRYAPIPKTTIFETVGGTLTAGGKAPLRYGYARVSTDDQSLNLQLDALHAAGCEGRIFTDKLSGKIRKRPGLEHMLTKIGSSDTVVVYRLDRIGRNFRDLVDIADELRERDANLISLSEGIDTSSSIGEVIYRLIFGSLALPKGIPAAKAEFIIAAANAAQRLDINGLTIDGAFGGPLANRRAKSAIANWKKTRSGIFQHLSGTIRILADN